MPGLPAQLRLTAIAIDSRQVFAHVGLSGCKQDAEVQAGRRALDRLDIRERCILFDALHTQRPTIARIIGGGYYSAPVKGNQPTMFDAPLEDLDWERQRTASHTWLSGGRVQTHTIRGTEDTSDCPD